MILQIFNAAAKVTNEWNLTAFALALLCVMVLVFLRRREATRTAQKVVVGAMIMLVILAALPLVARAYLQTRGVYRLRVTVEDPTGFPIEDATVTCSIGGEPKAVKGGWEFDIPSGARPADGNLTLYAEKKSDFLSGQTGIHLADDYNPATIVHLKHDRTAHIHGRVIDRRGNPIQGADVSVAGAADDVVSNSMGKFDLPAYAADGEPVELDVVKKGVGRASEWEQAGAQPVTVVLGAR